MAREMLSACVAAWLPALHACMHAAMWLDEMSDWLTSSSTDAVLRRDCKMAARQLQKQTSRYVDRFGPGAVVFSCGFAASLQVDPRIQIIGFDELQQGVQAYTKTQPRTGVGSGAGTGLANQVARGEKRKRKRTPYT